MNTNLATTPRQLAFIFQNLVHPAVFKADGAAENGGPNGPRVLVYPYKGPQGSPFIWLLLDGGVNTPMEHLIKLGGRVDNFREAVDCAVAALMERIG